MKIRENLVSPGRVITIAEADKKTGQKGPIGMVSEAHSGTTEQAVYNMAAIFLQSVVKEKNVNAVIINDSAVFLRLYAEETNREINFYFDRKTLKTDGSDEDAENYGSFSVIAYVLSNIIGGAERCSLSFDTAVDAYKKDGHISRSSLAILCDIFYYLPFSAGILEEEISVETGVNLTETLNQAIRKNIVKPISSLNELGLPQLIDFKKIVVEEKTEDIFSDVKMGKYLINYDFENSDKIRPLSALEGYEPNDIYYKAFNKINLRLNKCLNRMNAGLTGVDAIKNDYINMLMVGRPGTGKTVTGYALAESFGLPVVTINLGKGTEEDKFEGMTKVVNGQITSVGSDFERIYTTGGVIILEEINMPMQDMFMGAIGQGLVFPFVLMKDGYQAVYRHPLCVIIGTMNTGTAGSKKVNEAVSSRFPWKYRLNDPKEEDFIKILMAAGDFKKKDVMNVYKAYSSIINYLNDPMNPRGEDAMNITMRQCIGALLSIEEGCSLEEAIEDTMIGSLAENDLELAEEVYQNVVKTISF